MTAKETTTLSRYSAQSSYSFVWKTVWLRKCAIIDEVHMNTTGALAWHCRTSLPPNHHPSSYRQWLNAFPKQEKPFLAKQSTWHHGWTKHAKWTFKASRRNPFCSPASGRRKQDRIEFHLVGILLATQTVWVSCRWYEWTSGNNAQDARLYAVLERSFWECDFYDLNPLSWCGSKRVMQPCYLLPFKKKKERKEETKRKENEASATKGTTFQQHRKKHPVRSPPSGLWRACIIRQLSLVS